MLNYSVSYVNCLWYPSLVFLFYVKENKKAKGQIEEDKWRDHVNNNNNTKGDLKKKNLTEKLRQCLVMDWD